MTQLEHLTDGDWATVRRNFEKASQGAPVPQARVFNSTAISVANATLVVLTFDSERWDNGDLHSTATNTGRLTAPITGLYHIGACVTWAANVTGLRYASLRLNGTTTIVEEGFQAATTADGSRNNPCTTYQLAAGDYVEVVVFQRSGVALNATVAPNAGPEFWMYRVSGYTNAGIG